MATTITELYKKFKALTAGGLGVNAGGEVGNAIEKTKGYLVELNKDQLESGIDSNNNKLNPFYASDSYAKYKNRINRRAGFGVPDLKLTGAFHNSIFVNVSGGKFIFGATDSKTSDLVEKYGKEIFGLTKENQSYYATNVLREEILRIVERKTGLKAS